MLKEIINMKKTYTNINYFKTLNDGLNIPSEMIVLSKLREWKQNSSTAYISTKHFKSNHAAVKKFIKDFIKPNQEYICVVSQNKLYKPDTVEIYYKEF